MKRRMYVDEVLELIDEFIVEAHNEPIWTAESALRCLKAEILKFDIACMRGENTKGMQDEEDCDTYT